MVNSCTVEGCQRDARSNASPLCNAHYFRLWRTGSVGSASVSDRQRRPCLVDGCDRRTNTRGYCITHYRRLVKGGDVEYRPDRSGSGNPSWAGDAVTYSGMHQRLRKVRGSARLHECGCGGRASHWAYLHNDPDERASEAGPFSVKVECYAPMCVPCHKDFDLARLSV